ncbi:MAG: insulinase family protein, partial [Bacteroidaceae bacterium]
MRTTAPILRPMQAFTVPRPEQMVMKNGIPLKVIREGAQEVVRLDIIIGAGRWNQTQSLQALFTTRMLREGTKSLLSAEIAERLDYYGSWLDLSTTMQHSVLSLYTLSKHFPDTLAIIEQLLKEPTFPEEQLDLVLRNNRQQFLINREKVNFLSQQALCAAAFGPNHPMGISIEEWDYDRISASQLRDFFEKYYHSGNCKVFLSGLITEKEIQLVEETLGNVPWGDVKPFENSPHFQIQKADEKRIFLPKADSMQCAVSIGALMPTCQDPDSLALRVLIMVLGGYFGSR